MRSETPSQHRVQPSLHPVLAFWCAGDEGQATEKSPLPDRVPSPSRGPRLPGTRDGSRDHSLVPDRRLRESLPRCPPCEAAQSGQPGLTALFQKLGSAGCLGRLGTGTGFRRSHDFQENDRSWQDFLKLLETCRNPVRSAMSPVDSGRFPPRSAVFPLRFPPHGFRPRRSPALRFVPVGSEFQSTRPHSLPDAV